MSALSSWFEEPCSQDLFRVKLPRVSSGLDSNILGRRKVHRLLELDELRRNNYLRTCYIILSTIFIVLQRIAHSLR